MRADPYNVVRMSPAGKIAAASAAVAKLAT